jgi:hypothetical protein
MDKYIFLDIDGVLATPDFVKNGLWAINPAKQELLKIILDKTDAKIVLSSSWRKKTVEHTKQYMTENNFLFSDKIVGVTIRAYHYLDKSKSIHLSIPRGVEIDQWIDTNVHSENGKNFERKIHGKDFTYVILDDDYDMLLEQKDNYLKCGWDTGLTMEIVEKAIQILNND